MPGIPDNAPARFMGLTEHGAPTLPSVRARLASADDGGKAFSSFDAAYDGASTFVFAPLYDAGDGRGFRTWAPSFVRCARSAKAAVSASQRALVNGALSVRDLPRLLDEAGVPDAQLAGRILACARGAEVEALLRETGIADETQLERIRNAWISAFFDDPSWNSIEGEARLRCMRLLLASKQRTPHADDIRRAYALLMRLGALPDLPLHDAVKLAHVAIEAGFDETLAFETAAGLMLASPHFQLFRDIGTPAKEDGRRSAFLASTVHYLRYYFERGGRAMPDVRIELSMTDLDLRVAALKLAGDIRSWPAALHAEQAAEALAPIRPEGEDEAGALAALRLSLYDMACAACPDEHRAGPFIPRIREKMYALFAASDGGGSPPEGTQSDSGGCTPVAPSGAFPIGGNFSGAATSALAPALFGLQTFLPA